MSYRLRRMRSFRPLIHVLLALVFLVQGIGVASAGLSLANEPSPAQAEAVPCHGAMADAMASSSKPDQPSCCNAACPDMLTCALAVLAMPAAQTIAVSMLDRLPDVQMLPSLYPTAPDRAAFRPPIQLPA